MDKNSLHMLDYFIKLKFLKFPAPSIEFNVPRLFSKRFKK
jgi:hypothetical protein